MNARTIIEAGSPDPELDKMKVDIERQADARYVVRRSDTGSYFRGFAPRMKMWWTREIMRARSLSRESALDLQSVLENGTVTTIIPNDFA